MAITKREKRSKIRRRVRAKITGIASRPRMSIFRSNKQISIQIIDDLTGTTLVSASSLCKDISEKKDINKTEVAKLVGKLAAEKAIEKGINTIVFDRGGYLYHGRVKALADAARESGLKF